MPTFGPSSQNQKNRGASTSRLINCYRQAVPGAGRTGMVLQSVLGTEAFASTGNVFFYGSYEFRNDIYSAFGGKLFRIGQDATVTDLGFIAEGDTTFSSNNDHVTFAANGVYYTFLGSLSTPSIPQFSKVNSVDYIDQYTLAFEQDGRRFQWSDLADPTTFDGLNFAAAEANDDDIVRGVVLNGRVVIFKGASREVWYNTNQAGPTAFLRIAGGVRNTGLKSKNLLTKTDDGLFFVGNDNICRLTSDGLNARKLSHPPVAKALKESTPIRCSYYEDEEHKFCVIHFTDRPAWVFDMATAEWHERRDGTAWSILGAVRVGSTYFGFNDLGEVKKMVRNNADEANPLTRTAISETFYAEEGASLDEVEIYARTGFHTMTRDAQVWIRLSRDGGHTWTLEKKRSLGQAGEYRQKATWRAQGNFKQLTIEANISDPEEIPIWADYRMEAA